MSPTNSKVSPRWHTAKRVMWPGEKSHSAALHSWALVPVGAWARLLMYTAHLTPRC